ncbi:TetR/AcrR family transcriptional regulator [Streptomyces sp. NPDC056361]|uniref:TetR/AcrR family transcriptional regulator n=1 Tax=unclassified Streptomyces TaxID=2593676 RepID=UPI0035E24EAB
MTMLVPDGSAAGASTRPLRKHQARGERRIDQIVDAAEELIADLGVEAVGMNAIARHAGISPGSLYQYFPGKSAIVEELCRRLVGQLQHMAGRASHPGSRPAPQAPATALDHLLEAAVLLAGEHPALLPLLTTTERREQNVLLEAISRSLPAGGALPDEDVARDLATRIFCSGVSLAAQQADPGALLVLTRQAVLSSLRVTADL